MTKNPLHIAMLGHKRIPSREGGIEVVVEELSVRMAERGNVVTCYNRKGHNVAGAEYDVKIKGNYRGVTIKEVFTIEKKGIAAISSAAAASLRAAFGKYDVVHIHAEGPASMCWIPKLAGKRVIVTVHGLDHQRAKWGKLAAACIMLGERNAVRYADEIIVLSRKTQEYFKTVYGRQTCFIPNGVKEPQLRPVDRIKQEWGIEKDSYILFLGRLVPEKGLQYLIEAFLNVKTEKKLVIAGGTSDSGDFLQEIRKQSAADSRILFTGFVQGRIKHELYSNAYLYVLPSDLEGMPLSLMEAMSYGNCCLCSDIPECTEVVDNHAVSFSKGNVEDLRQKLQMLCDQPQLVAQYKEQAHDYIVNRFGWDDVVDQTLKLYAKGQ